jgi:hypothetical protein
MKKIIVIMVLLLAAGGAVFHLGWVQMKLPANSVGVAFTKTRGWDAEPLPPGRFVWRWERLLPGNMALHVYPIETYSADISLSGGLPSGEVYALFMEGRPSFRYSIRFVVTYRLKPEHFPLLASRDKVLPEGLPAYAESLKAGMTEAASAAVDEFFASPPREGAALSADALKTRILARHPFLDIEAVNAVETSLPDPALYARGRELYFAAQDGRKEAVFGESRELAVETLREERQLERLKKYGELLSRYPDLIEFLAIEKLSLQDISDQLRRRQGSGN